MTATKAPTDPFQQPPYPECKFKLKWAGNYVAGFKDLSAFGSRAQGSLDQPQLPGSPAAPDQTYDEPLTLRSGQSRDTAFLEWANRYAGAPPDRRDIVIELWNEANQVVQTFSATGARATELEFAPRPDPDDPYVFGIDVLVLDNQGWSPVSNG